MIVKESLALVMEGQKLVADEQGGFRKGRGCRDQIMTLILLGQTQMAVRKAGMIYFFADHKTILLHSKIGMHEHYL